ncbi:MAG: hypothetical protein D8B38_00935 [Candidatus Saccharimonas sp.]|nr:MAG: hypothetical protein D8B38_00935 [Candidatus Saccharimonas sp.]
MLLTKYKVQELVESVEIDMDEVEARTVAFVKEFDDDSVTLVYATVEIFKDKILDELGRL